MLEGVYPERLAAITQSPRHYGFHATLKPPFRLADRQSDEALHKEVEKFVARQIPFTIPELEIGVLDRFIAVRPSWPCTALQSLGDDCLRAFDVFRAPPSEEERAKRQAAGLTPAQEKLLERWGYPYVFEDFRPHFSLTERIEDSAERYTVHQAIRTICEPEIARRRNGGFDQHLRPARYPDAVLPDCPFSILRLNRFVQYGDERFDRNLEGSVVDEFDDIWSRDVVSIRPIEAFPDFRFAFPASLGKPFREHPLRRVDRDHPEEWKRRRARSRIARETLTITDRPAVRSSVMVFGMP